MKDELRRALGARLLACRCRADRMWSQDYCYTRAGISKRQWQRLEAGKCTPMPLTWEALKRLFPELGAVTDGTK